MGGGLIQLVAYGAQDIHLTGNPQITFFKVVYRRHTNFSMESIEQVWDGISTSPGKCTSTISRNGDLITKLYLEIDCIPFSKQVISDLAERWKWNTFSKHERYGWGNQRNRRHYES